MKNDADAIREILLGLTPEQLDAWFHRIRKETGERAYRLGQIRDWLYRRTPASFEAMDNLPAALRTALAAHAVLHPLNLELKRVSRDETEKYLWKRASGETIESVMIPDLERITYCISSQAGCPVRCSFCATGHGGFRGNLETAEIVDQVARMRSETGRAPTNIVFMGMGEPLLNFEAVSRALEILTHRNQFAIGARRITVSTVGIPDRIRELADRFPQVNLALSLHAARDPLRDELVPMNRKYPLGHVLDAILGTTVKTHRLVTFEYVVLPGVNDQPKDIEAIVRRTAGIPASVNLIGFNPFPGARYEKPSVPHLVRFRDRLAAKFPGAVTLRRSRGDDIDAACGQLAAR